MTLRHGLHGHSGPGIIPVGVQSSGAAVMHESYYVDRSGGNDANDGRSEATPWQTFTNLNGGVFNSLEDILLKRGEIWREKLTVPSSGAAGALITFGAYGSGDAPEINGSDLITGWSDEGGDVWSAALTTDPNHVLFDDVRGTQETAQANLNAAREWYWNANVLYVYSTSDPDTAYILPGIEAAIRDHAIEITSKDYVRIENLYVTKMSRSGIHANGCDYCAFNSIEVDEAGRNGLRLDDSNYCTVTGGHYHHNGTLGTDPDTAENLGAGVIVEDGSHHNTVANLESNANVEDGVGISGDVGQWAGTANIISGCHLHHNLEDGVDIKSGDQSVIDTLIEDNVAWGIIIHNDADICTVTGCTFYRNSTSHFVIAAVTGSCIFECYDCFFGVTADTNATVHLGNSNGPHKFVNCLFEDGATNRQLQIEEGAGHEVYHCTFYNPSGGATSLLRFTDNAANVRVSNNIFWGNGVRCIRYDAGVTVAAADNNIYLRADVITNWINYQGTYYDKSDIEDGTMFAAKGTDEHSITGNPLMVDPANDDYHLQVGSPCRGAGEVGLGVARDFDGVLRGSPPDIGAYEYVA